ncbi:hypothetical protein TNCV_818191 [Trichonephila clavipes]|nr:hypothetical protein TNCV_818191 [Trichonephila clavipes]
MRRYVPFRDRHSVSYMPLATYENREQRQSRFGPIRRIYAPCLMIVLMNCQTKLRINRLTAVKSVAILESNANLNFYTWKKTLFILLWPIYRLCREFDTSDVKGRRISSVNMIDKPYPTWDC